MNDLTIIENDLVPVYEASTGEKVVYGTELHSVLEVKSNYREWIKRRLSECDATENEDFQAVEISTPSGQKTKEHIIKLDTAKEMAMLEHNEKGKQVRRYFIQVEKKYKENIKPLSQLQILQQSVEVLNRHDQELKQIDTRMDKLEYEIPLYGSEADELSNHVKRKGVNIMGGKQSEAYKDTEIRSKVYRDIYDQIKREFGIYGESGHAKSYKALKRKYIADAHELIDCYEAPKYLHEMINDANAQIKFVVVEENQGGSYEARK